MTKGQSYAIYLLMGVRHTGYDNQGYAVKVKSDLRMLAEKNYNDASNNVTYQNYTTSFWAAVLDRFNFDAGSNPPSIHDFDDANSLKTALGNVVYNGGQGPCPSRTEDSNIYQFLGTWV